MGALLTLHRPTDPPPVPDGFVEHPVELARRALLQAAEIEPPHWSRALRYVADSLPDRAPIRKTI